MSNEDILNKEVGNIDRKSLEAKPVTIVGTSIEEVLGKKGSKNEGKVVGKKLVLLCKHPDQEDVIKISQAKFIKGESVKVSTLWINFDEEENIQKDSAVALLLNKAEVKKMKELVGKELSTEKDLAGVYLCIKVY